MKDNISTLELEKTYLRTKCLNEKLDKDIISGLEEVLINANKKEEDINYEEFLRYGFRSVIERSRTRPNQLSTSKINFISNSLVSLLTIYHNS